MASFSSRYAGYVRPFHKRPDEAGYVVTFEHYIQWMRFRRWCVSQLIGIDAPSPCPRALPRCAPTLIASLRVPPGTWL